MKIIDNKKDYYDYLASIYGIDELVVYDRRGSVTLNTDKVLLHGMEYYFSNRILFQDKPLTDKQYWNLRSIAKQREAKADIWQNLYQYLSSLRDKPFIDTRSDIQKLESAGFDKKTCFRNIK